MIIASVYDSKAEIYSQPQMFINKGALIRAWQTAVNDPQSDFHKYPGDYTMFIIGEWDDHTGTLTNYDVKDNIGLAYHFMAQTPQTQPAITPIKGDAHV